MTDIAGISAPNRQGRTRYGVRSWAVTPVIGAFLAVPRFRDNPYPGYSMLQRVDRRHDSPMGAWLLFGHEDCATVLRNSTMSVGNSNIDFDWLMERRLTRRLFAGGVERSEVMTTGRRLMSRLLLFLDAPDHTRIRALVSKAFTPRAVAVAEPAISDQVAVAVDRLRSRGTMDLISELAYPLPARIICGLLGVPAEDHDLVVSQAPAIARRLDPIINADIIRESDHAAEVLVEYLDGLIDSRRRQPGWDIISALIAAEEGGERLDHDELLSILVLLLIAGHETTANLVGNGLLSMLRHRPALERWREDPEVGRSGVEELLRFCGPIQMTQRVTTEPTQLGDSVLQRGRIVILLLGAANRDLRVFDQPHQLRLDRTPNPHLAFSSGAHFCLGAPLARLEARLMLDQLVQLPGLRVDGPVKWRPSFTIRGLRALSLRWE